MTKQELAQQIFDEYYEDHYDFEFGDPNFQVEKVKEITNWLDEESINDEFDTVYLDWCEHCDIDYEYSEELEYEIDLGEYFAKEYYEEELEEDGD